MLITICTNVVTDPLLSLSFPFAKTKNKNQIFSKLVVQKREIFLLSVCCECALLQRHAEFSRLLQKHFLISFSYSCHGFMLLLTWNAYRGNHRPPL